MSTVLTVDYKNNRITIEDGDVSEHFPLKMSQKDNLNVFADYADDAPTSVVSKVEFLNVPLEGLVLTLVDKVGNVWSTEILGTHV